MNERQLKSLLTAVECGSFSKAEDVLYLSKQALKKQIDSLEEEAGFSIIVRTRQGISLTPAGTEFCREAKRILADLSAVTQRCKEIAFSEESIRIANPYHPRLMLEKAFDEFSRRFPSVKQRIVLQNTDQLFDDIIHDRADLAECTYHPQFTGSGVACTKLFPMPYKCLVSSSHPLAGKKIIHLEDLCGQQVYLLQNNTALISQLTENCRGMKLNLIATNDMQEISNICYNKGIFVSKAYYIGFMQPLVAIPLDTDIVPMAAVMHRESPSQVVKEFIKIVQELYPSSQDFAEGE